MIITRKDRIHEILLHCEEYTRPELQSLDDDRLNELHHEIMASDPLKAFDHDWDDEELTCPDDIDEYKEEE